MKDFVQELFRPHVFHVHLERRLHERWNAHADPVLLVKLALDGIVHQSSQAGRNNDTKGLRLDHPMQTTGSWTYSATSVLRIP